MSNYYIVVEGKKSEKAVYPTWISYLNPELREIQVLDDFDSNNFYLVSGNGYPYYFQVIDDAIKDLEDNNKIDFLVISVDSEDNSLEEKKNEIVEYIGDRVPSDKLKIIIQHFCLETWALGNKAIFTRNPQDPLLREFISEFNVLTHDPEDLPSFDKYDYNRAQFAEVYLRKIFNEKYHNLTYTKRNPKPLLHPKYYSKLVERLESDNHIKSFQTFLDAFVS